MLTSRSASSTCRSGPASRCSCASTRSSASSAVSSTSRATATTPRCACAVQEILTSAWHGTLDAFYTHVRDSPLARLQFYDRRPTRRACPTSTSTRSNAPLVEAGRSWTDRLDEALVAEHGEEEGTRLPAPLPGRVPRVLLATTSTSTTRSPTSRASSGARAGRPRAAPQPLPRVEASGCQLTLQGLPCGEPDPAVGRAPHAREHGLPVLGEVPVSAAPERTSTQPRLDPRVLPRARGTARRSTSAACGSASTRPSRQVWQRRARERRVQPAGALRRTDARARWSCCAPTRATCARRACPSARAYVQQTLASQPRRSRACWSTCSARASTPRGRDDAEARELDPSSTSIRRGARAASPTSTRTASCAASWS